MCVKYIFVADKDVVVEQIVDADYFLAFALANSGCMAHCID